MGQIQIDAGDARQAEALLEEALCLRSRQLPGEHWLVGEALNALGAALAAQGRYPDAESLLLDGYTLVERKLGTRSRMTQRCAQRVARLYALWERADLHSAWRVWSRRVGPPLSEPDPDRAPDQAPARRPWRWAVQPRAIGSIWPGSPWRRPPRFARGQEDRMRSRPSRIPSPLRRAAAPCRNRTCAYNACPQAVARLWACGLRRLGALDRERTC
jgi:hypothetical protein